MQARPRTPGNHRGVNDNTIKAFPAVLRFGLVPIILILSWQVIFRPSHINSAASPQILMYIESSNGLIPPTMEGGRTEIEMGDVNADGKLDLVSIGDHGSPWINSDEYGVMVWFGDGNGNWSVYRNGNFGYGGVALGDVNNDGNVDVGYGMHHDYSNDDFGDQLLEVALGDGSGQNWYPWDDGLANSGESWGMFGTDFADVDSDGDLDIGSISFGCCAGIHVYLNQGNGTWNQSFGFLGGNSQMHFVFNDVNGDGNVDFAASHQYGTVYTGDGSGSFVLEDGNLPPPPLTGHSGVSLRDVNHNGAADLAFCNSSGGIEVWSWVVSQTWQDLSGSLPNNGNCEATQLFDMDMDGHVDVVSFGEGQVRIWLGDGAGGWNEVSPYTTPSPGYLSAFRVGGDADLNGYPDMVLVAEEGSWPNEQNHIRFYRESSVPTTLEIKPVYPQGSETFIAGSVTFVDWISAVPGGEMGTVDLELSTTGQSGPWLPITSGLPNGGRYQWIIPPDTPTTSNAYLRYTLTTSSGTTSAFTSAPFEILGGSEEPISGLEATNDSPTGLGQNTHLTATVSSGTNIYFEWDLGDGSNSPGEAVSHMYPALGIYTAIVTASNSVNTMSATTIITITDQPISGLSFVNDSPTILGENTVFSAEVSTGTNVTFTLAYGDGTLPVSGDINPGIPLTFSYSYQNPGDFTALITASNSIDQGIADSLVEIVAPTPSPTLPPDPIPTSTVSPTAPPTPTKFLYLIPVAFRKTSR